jgi:hypothetical protein
MTDTSEELRLWSPGDQANVDIAVSDQIRFRDPVSGMIYAARNYGTEVVNTKMAPVQTTGAARMLQYATQLMNLAYNCTPGAIPDPDGSGITYPSCTTSTPKDIAMAAKFKGYMSNLAEARDFSKWLDAFY